MKNLTLLFLLLLCFAACSVEDDGMENINEKNNFQPLNLSFEGAGCDAQTFDFGYLGKLEVINDEENLYVVFTASQGYSLSGAKVHIAGDLSGFPTVGRGNLPPGKMDHKESFEPGVGEYTYQVSLADLDESFLIAAQGVFNDEENTFQAWAGDVAGKSGDWSYFAYQVCTPCEPADAGEDNSEEFTLAEVDASSLETLFLGMLSEGVSAEGTFYPTLAHMTEAYNKYKPLATFTTTYTVGEGDCEDSAVLSIKVICDLVSAEDDNSITLLYDEIGRASEIHSLFRNAYLSLLSEGVPEDGTFRPTIEQIVQEFRTYELGEFDTTYTVGEGECEDSIKLYIEVVACLRHIQDNSVTLTNSQFRDQVGNVAELKSKYLSLLSEGVSEDGTFYPTIEELASAYNENNIGTFSTFYLIRGLDFCNEYMELSITVTADPGGGDTGGGGGGGGGRPPINF